MPSDKITTIDEYLATQSPQAKKILVEVRRRLKKLVPEATEAMAYGIPTLRRHGKNLVHYAGFKSHVGFYPGASGIAAFAHEFQGLKWAKGSVQFPLDQPIPYDLMERITRFRMNEQDAEAP